MEFQEVVRRRRMVRNHADQPVSREVLQRIGDTAQRAPSAGFSQGTRLVVVTEEAGRRSVARICDEPAYVARGFDPWLSRAAALFIPCVSEEVYRARYREPDKRRPGKPEREWAVPYWWMDAGCVVMLILLAAVDEGLSAGFLEVRRPPELQAELGIPSDFMPVGVISVGPPASDRRSSSLERGRLRTEEFVRWERW
jgi:nitroreductase